ncbi:MAG: hypothetical protein AAF492_28625, partial [Verrucomicrobiota bacterium]
RKLMDALPELQISLGVDLEKEAARFAERRKEAEANLKVLKWIPASDEVKPPKSRPGEFTTVTIKNTRDHTVKLYWVEYGGPLRHYADIAAGETLKRDTYSNATWIITDEKEKQLGHFMAITDDSKIDIPK